MASRWLNLGELLKPRAIHEVNGLTDRERWLETLEAEPRESPLTNTRTGTVGVRKQPRPDDTRKPADA